MAPGDDEARELRKMFSPPLRWGTARMTHRRIQNFALAQIEHLSGADTLKSLPVKLTIESTNICNLRCTACPTGAERKGRQTGHMSLELFSWLMRELGPTLFEVELHNWGEPLLGRNVFDFIQLASDAGVSATISTNFSIPFDEARAERLVSSGLSVLGVSIDGATQAAYEQYRVRGDLQRVLENCKLVAAAKRRLRSETPLMIWNYHVFSHNVTEVETARALAEELGMIFSSSRGWVVGPEDPALSSIPYFMEGGFPERCYFLWFQAVVHHEGGVAPCCGTFYAEDDFHRLALDRTAMERASFRDIWNGPNFVTARKLFNERTGGPETKRLACFDCPATTNFEGWKAALQANATEFHPTPSNDGFNFFWNRTPASGPGLVRLRRSANG